MDTSEKRITKIDKSKYLVPPELTLSQFVEIIRRRIKLTSEQAIFLFIMNEDNPSGVMASMSSTMAEIYDTYKSKDNFLYISYASENTFGL